MTFSQLQTALAGWEIDTDSEPPFTYRVLELHPEGSSAEGSKLFGSWLGMFTFTSLDIEVDEDEPDVARLILAIKFVSPQDGKVLKDTDDWLTLYRCALAEVFQVISKHECPGDAVPYRHAFIAVLGDCLREMAP